MSDITITPDLEIKPQIEQPEWKIIDKSELTTINLQTNIELGISTATAVEDQLNF